MKVFGKVTALLILGSLVSMATAQDVSLEKVTIRASNAPIASTLKSLFSHRAKFTLAKDVTGRVSIDAKNVAFETAVRYLLSQVDATYTYANGNYTITRKRKPQS